MELRHHPDEMYVVARGREARVGPLVLMGCHVFSCDLMGSTGVPFTSSPLWNWNWNWNLFRVLEVTMRVYT